MHLNLAYTVRSKLFFGTSEMFCFGKKLAASLIKLKNLSIIICIPMKRFLASGSIFLMLLTSSSVPLDSATSLSSGTGSTCSSSQESQNEKFWIKINTSDQKVRLGSFIDHTSDVNPLVTRRYILHG
jgi:hypothetical protein